MTLTLTREVSRGKIVLSWEDDQADPVGGWQVFRQEILAGVAIPDTFGQVATVDYKAYAEPLRIPGTGDQWAYQVKNPDSGEEDRVFYPYRYGELVAAWPAGTVRYTTLDEVKEALGVPLTDATKDTAIEAAITATEVAIDFELGRSFPDPVPGGQYTSVPNPVKQVALSASVAVYQFTTGPFGSQGSDDWFGAQDTAVGDLMRREIRSNPLLVGFHVAPPIA